MHWSSTVTFAPACGVKRQHTLEYDQASGFQAQQWYMILPMALGGQVWLDNLQSLSKAPLIADSYALPAVHAES